ncbi:MAG: glycosyl transferase group 1 [Proteobacteria bacterium SG_bin6]|nr:MAG: glycosyl transferase group 1 [Proteobacteria bacterium SG_bin6]
MRIAYISVATPFSRASWSGIPWYSHREILRRFPDTHVLETPRLDLLTDRLAFAERLGVLVRRQPILTYHYTRLIEAQLERLRPDAIVAVAAAHKLAYINPKWPLIYAADAMYATIVDYYSKYANFSSGARRRGNMVQRALIERIDRALLCSQWAADAARETYGMPPEKLRIVPMGANLDADPGFEPPKPGQPLRLLFVGFAWERKGGPLLLEIWKALRAHDPLVELHIVGASPAAARGLPGVVLHGRIDKSDRAAHARLSELYRRASFFVMPSREEAFGIVFCEAAAFGRPSVAADTGGVGSVILDGDTGLLLPIDASPAEYAERILSVWRNPERHAAMCHAARRDYERRLNWSAWGDAVAEAIKAVAKSTHSQPAGAAN